MFDDLFQKKPEYDENGQLVGYSQPKIVWIILALVVLYCFKDKLMKQEGGGKSGVSIDWWDKKYQSISTKIIHFVVKNPNIVLVCVLFIIIGLFLLYDSERYYGFARKVIGYFI